MFRRRDRAPAADERASMADAIARRLPLWVELDERERDRLVDIAWHIVRTVRWEAAAGFELDDDVVATIAGHAAVPVLELGVEHYRDVSSIIVHPRTIVLHGTHLGPAGTRTQDPDHLLGQAHYRGPVLLAWTAVWTQARHPDRGKDVVIHEFAHRLDMLDGVVDGTPPLEANDVQRWVDVCTEEFDAIQDGPADPLLGSYAASDPGEFFAVASEVFFTRPVELEEAKPELYELLHRYYRQHPADRRRRHLALTAGDAGSPTR